jgi:predicted acylesterase/phospholipase RssA
MNKIIICLIFLSFSTFSNEISVGVTTSGGVSLGTYEAGFHYYLAEYTKVNKKRLKPSFKGINYYTGASAGAANSIMSIFESCNKDRIEIEDSILWKFWTNMSTNDLLKEKDTTPISLLSTHYVKSEIYPIFRKIWNKGFAKNCDVVLGIAVTRLEPEYLEWEDTVEVPRLAEHFIFRIKGQGLGKTPSIENYVIPEYSNYQILYPFTKDQKKNFEGLLDVAQASTAFPLAFPPVELKHCYISKNKKCTEKNSRSALFIDGGLFDNIPLNLLKVIQDKNEKRLHKNKRKKVLFYVSPYSKAFMKEIQLKKLGENYDAREHVSKIFGNFIDSARKRELREYTQERDSLLVPSVRYFPLASSPMFAFFGFIEKDFRLYDFYLGMVDARMLLKKHTKDLDKTTVHFPEDDKFKTDIWTPFFCIAAYLDDNKYKSHCTKKMEENKSQMANFISLFKVSLTKLYYKCDKKKSSLSHPVCTNIREGKLSLNDVLKNDYGKNLKQLEGESDSQYTLRLLQLFEFEFKDLKIPKEKNNFAPYVIQKKFNTVVSKFTELQNKENQLQIDFAITNALSTLAIKQYDSNFYAEFGTGMELGFTNSLTLSKFSTGFTKLNLGVLILSTDNYFSKDNRSIGVTPIIGIQQAIPNWSSTNVFHNFGLNAGYQFSNGDQYRTEDCNIDRFNGDESACSGFSFQPNYMIVLFQRLRLKLYGNYLMRKKVDNSFNVGFHLGLNFGGKY